MPYLVAVFLGGLAKVVGPLAARVLTALGFGVVSYAGASIVIDTLLASVTTGVGGLPATILSFAGIMKVDVAVNLIIAAVTARLALAPLKKLLPS